RDLPSSAPPLCLRMFSPTSTIRSRVSIMIFRGDSNLPVMLAGQTEVHRPHSVHVYASNKFFQVRSCTSLAPNRAGISVSVGENEGSSMAFTSLVTLSILVKRPLGYKFEK